MKKKERNLPATTFQVVRADKDDHDPVMHEGRVSTVTAFTPKSARLQARQRHGEAVDVRPAA